MELQGKKAVVTGAGLGIGRGIALVLAKHGADVALTDLQTDNAKKVADEIRAAGRNSCVLQQDVTSWDSCVEVARKSAETLGDIDIIVNNAGVSKCVPFLELTAEEWDRVHDVNAKGVFLNCRAFAPSMVKRKYGKIINIASMVGKEAFPLFSHYCASKFAVVGFTQSLAKELAVHNVNVNAVCPGVVKTPLWGPLLDQLSKKNNNTPEESWQNFTASIPLQRPQTPEDIGEVVSFLASDRAKNITADAANVSGGQVIW